MYNIMLEFLPVMRVLSVLHRTSLWKKDLIYQKMLLSGTGAHSGVYATHFTDQTNDLENLEQLSQKSSGVRDVSISSGAHLIPSITGAMHNRLYVCLTCRPTRKRTEPSGGYISQSSADADAADDDTALLGRFLDPFDVKPLKPLDVRGGGGAGGSGDAGSGAVVAGTAGPPAAVEI